MKRKAPWIVVMAFSAFSVGAIAADGDSSRSKLGPAEDPLSASPAPGEPLIYESDRTVSSGSETRATDSRAANSRYETRAPGHAPSSHQAANVPSFEQADRDGNGVIDLQEAAGAGINFTAANQDGDAFVSKREYFSWVAQVGHEPPRDRS